MTGKTPTSDWALHYKTLKIDSDNTQDSLRTRTGWGDSARGTAVQGPEPVQELGEVQRPSTLKDVSLGQGTVTHEG